jgi:N-acetylglucosaminylphosphatidylinositol deacetylase
VSGHVNHTSVHRGVLKGAGGGVAEVYVLDSTSVLCKYVGVLGVLFTACASSSKRGGGGRRYVSLDVGVSYRAMSAHASQFVWFRRLFVVASRYTYCNTFSRC